MEHITEHIDFCNIENPSFVVADIRLVGDPSKSDLVKRFVVSHYSIPTEEFTEKDFEEHSAEYQMMITWSIFFNNLTSLNILWKGIYHYDRASPDYHSDLHYAAFIGNLKTFQHILFAFNNYDQKDDPDELVYEELVKLATQNDLHPEVLLYIKSKLSP